MHSLLDLLRAFDHDVTDAVTDLRWGPATPLFVLISSWMIKGPIFVVAGFVADLRAGRRLPVIALAVLGAVLLGSLLSTELKPMFERPRPPLAALGIDAAVPVPDSWSFPSGHALTTFAGATAVALLLPRMRVAALTVAALVAASRVYLGVHFVSDVVVGGLLGALAGLLVALALRQAARGRLAAQLSP